MKGKAIEEALKDITDETKRNILAELLKEASEFEGTVELSAIVNAKCQGPKVFATTEYLVTVQAGGLSFSERVKKRGPFRCPALDSSCCSCKYNPWRKDR